MTEQNGNNKPNEAEGLAFPLSGNEKLIEEAKHLIEQAGSFREQVGDDASPTSMIGLWLRTADALHAALAVFENAHTHECEMCRWENGFGARKPLTHTCEKNLSTDDFPHGHPEMDPTDDAQEAVDRLDQCLANRDAGVGAWSMVRPEDVRMVLAALRAAGGVR